MGLYVTRCRSTKQNLNEKISTQAELVGASGYVPYNIQYIMFMHHQGYLNRLNKFFQDNQSETTMEINGRNLCTFNFWHIDIRYLFVKYHMEKGYISVMYFLTHLILADYFTKTLQGYLFSNSRDILMGIVSPYTLLKYITSYSSKQNVDNQIPRKKIILKKIPSENKILS